jgi:hypothetical protein
MPRSGQPSRDAAKALEKTLAEQLATLRRLNRGSTRTTILTLRT